MVGDGETMRLVTNTLQQIHAFGLTFENDWIIVVRNPYLFQTFRQSADGHIVHAAILQCFRCRHDLRLATVNHHEIRLICEMMTVDVLLHRRLLALFGFPTFVVHAFAGIACNIAMPESTRQRLIQCAQIVKRALPIRSANGETTIFRLLGDRILEHYHGSDLERATNGIGNVVAFDT